MTGRNRYDAFTETRIKYALQLLATRPVGDGGHTADVIAEVAAKSGLETIVLRRAMA